MQLKQVQTSTIGLFHLGSHPCLEYFEEKCVDETDWKGVTVCLMERSQEGVHGGKWLKKPDPEVIKLFFILNSAEQEIYPAHKC